MTTSAMHFERIAFGKNGLESLARGHFVHASTVPGSNTRTPASKVTDRQRDGH